VAWSTGTSSTFTGVVTSKPSTWVQNVRELDIIDHLTEKIILKFSKINTAASCTKASANMLEY